MKAVRVNIVGIANLPLEALCAFQEDIKILTEERYESLKTEILEDGFSFSPHVFFDAEGKAWILDGHQRRTCLERMKAEGYEIPIIPCMEVQAESLEHARRLVLAGTSQYGTFQPKKIVEFVKKTGLAGEEVLKRFDLPGITLKKLVAVGGHLRGGHEGEDEQPEEPKVARTKLGEIYRLGRHRLLIGDCTSPENVEKLFGEVRAELCFTSPPYADQREYGGGQELSTQKLAQFISAAREKVNFFGVNLGMSRKNGEVNSYWDDYVAEARRAGLKLLSWNIWDRSGMAYSIGNATAMFTIDHEWIFVFGEKPKELNKTVENKTYGKESGGNVRQKDGTMEYGEKSVVNSHRQLGTVLRTDLQRGNEFDHPARFPVALPEAYLLAFTDSGEFVYDPFGGSGTTMIAAEKHGRGCLMMELNPIYADMILARWEKFTGEKAELEQ